MVARRNRFSAGLYHRNRLGEPRRLRRLPLIRDRRRTNVPANIEAIWAALLDPRPTFDFVENIRVLNADGNDVDSDDEEEEEEEVVPLEWDGVPSFDIHSYHQTYPPWANDHVWVATRPRTGLSTPMNSFLSLANRWFEARGVTSGRFTDCDDTPNHQRVIWYFENFDENQLPNVRDALGFIGDQSGWHIEEGNPEDYSVYRIENLII